MKHKRKLIFSKGLIAALVAIVCCAGCGKSATDQQSVTLVFSTLTFTQALFHGDPYIIREFTRDTGIHVKLLPYGTSDMGARRQQDLAWLKQHASTPDVYEADIVDIGSLADKVLDLSPYMDADDRQNIPAIMRNFTFHGRVVALPVHTDVGLLFYRTDLLKKYGYAHPPKTWDELEKMAARIQASERAAGDKAFWGFVWEGSPQNEGLTYTALEWQASNGGGQIIEPDGTISVNNPWTIEALRRARKWVGTISPPAVTAYQMDDLSNAWLSGHAAFMRNWPYYYSIGEGPDSLARGKIAVAPLPAGRMGPAGTLGGWQLLVSKYSNHPKEAVELVKYLTSSRAQVRLAREFSWMPTRLPLYDDPQLLKSAPYFAWLKDEFPRLAVARPSSVTGDKYLAVSAAYKKAVHQVLAGQEDAADAMAKLEKQLAQITGLPIRRPVSPLPFTATAPSQ
ncbi:MAG TPA: ABC transporter substrate-binding protein [Candidatus Acidoferrales bacterium]|nr:ABC transporter substrate-binding protein [Candidatus Acidoferrales bacterium]